MTSPILSFFVIFKTYTANFNLQCSPLSHRTTKQNKTLGTRFIVTWLNAFEHLTYLQVSNPFSNFFLQLKIRYIYNLLFPYHSSHFQSKFVNKSLWWCLSNELQNCLTSISLYPHFHKVPCFLLLPYTYLQTVRKVKSWYYLQLCDNFLSICSHKLFFMMYFFPKLHVRVFSIFIPLFK